MGRQRSNKVSKNKLVKIVAKRSFIMMYGFVVERIKRLDNVKIVARGARAPPQALIHHRVKRSVSMKIAD